MESGFREKVYAIVSRVPPGKVASYGQVALLAGNPRAARMVGNFMSHCPDGSGLPCHRVIRGDGSLCDGYEFGVVGAQRALLRSEGVPFRKDGRVDMENARWDGQ